MTTVTDPAGTRLLLSGVSLIRDGKPVLSGLDLDRRVTRLGIVGRNGSGKSTLARLLAGLVAPSGGELRLDGIDPARDRKAALQKVGIIFQNPDHQLIFPTVIEEIAFGLTQQGQSRTRANDNARKVLARFGKPHWHDAYVNALSQGQKHLVCLMSIVAMAPGLLILDEPFAGLDIPTKAQLRRHLELFRGALIHITHDPADLAGYDQVLWLDQGKIRDCGPAAQVLTDFVACMHRIGEGNDLADLAG
ncbi:energy-coupling factor ABC transporter ATP-binding protein [Paracoccus sp. (in: a-proteobacteria)]|uniref:energy-coupling factor ABC transporter ATP-binding protein n=1 Tax=Paracoccus sp. TaxID=267 RepID=UPI003A88ECAC